MANRILVVDDNSDIRENICEYLNLRGHQTIGASDAASAAQLIAEEDLSLMPAWKLFCGVRDEAA